MAKWDHLFFYHVGLAVPFKKEIILVGCTGDYYFKDKRPNYFLKKYRLVGPAETIFSWSGSDT